MSLLSQSKPGRTNCQSLSYSRMLKSHICTFIPITTISSQTISLYIYAYYNIFSICSLVFYVQYTFFPLHLLLWSFVTRVAGLLLQIFLNIEKMTQCQDSIHVCVITVNYTRCKEGFLQFLPLTRFSI